MSKAKVTVQSKSVFINLSIPFEIGNVSGNAIMQVAHFEKIDDTIGTEVEYADLENLNYMGCEVSDSGKLVEFHKELGINLHKLIEDEVLEIANQWSVDNFSKNTKLW